MWLKRSEWWVEWQQMRPEGGQRVQANRQSWYTVCFFILRGTELLSVHLDQAKSSASSPFLFLICLCWSPEPPPMMVAIWSEGGADRQWVHTPWRAVCLLRAGCADYSLSQQREASEKRPRKLGTWPHALSCSPCSLSTVFFPTLPLQGRLTSLSL